MWPLGCRRRAAPTSTGTIGLPGGAGRCDAHRTGEAARSAGIVSEMYRAHPRTNTKTPLARLATVHRIMAEPPVWGAHSHAPTLHLASQRPPPPWPAERCDGPSRPPGARTTQSQALHQVRLQIEKVRNHLVLAYQQASRWRRSGWLLLTRDGVRARRAAARGDSTGQASRTRARDGS